MAAHGYRGGYTARWRTLREIVAEALTYADKQPARALSDIAIFTKHFTVKNWVVYDIIGDESRKRITVRVKRERADEGVPALTGPQDLTDEQRETVLNLARRTLAGQLDDEYANRFTYEYASELIQRLTPAVEAAA